MVSKVARQNLEAHIRGERQRDIEALMAPLSDHPSYVIPNWVFNGRDAVRAMYERVLPMLSDELSDEYLRALDDAIVTRWGETHCVIEYSDDYPLHRGMVVIVHFDGDKVKSENTYFTSVQRFPASAADDAWAGVTGATRIK